MCDEDVFNCTRFFPHNLWHIKKKKKRVRKVCLQKRFDRLWGRPNFWWILYIYIHFFISSSYPYALSGLSGTPPSPWRECIWSYTPPDNPALFLHSPRIRACTRLLWCGKTSMSWGKNPHQEQRAEESNLSMFYRKQAQVIPSPPAG